MYAVLRRYQVRLGAPDTAARQARSTLLPVLRQVSGFAAYYLVNSGDGTVASIALFNSPEAAAAGDRLVGEWFRDDWPAFRAVPPALASGEVLVAEELRGEERPETAGVGVRLERRSGAERRYGPERRSVPDRRVA